MIRYFRSLLPISELWPEFPTRIAKWLWGIGQIWLPLLAGVAIVAIHRGSSSVDLSPPLGHKVCPECQKLLKDHRVKLINPELSGCGLTVHAAERLKSKYAR